MAKENKVVIGVSKSREIHVQINEWKGRRELDIRTFVKSPTYTGYSPKGLRIPLEKGLDLCNAINRVLSQEEVGE